MRRSLSSRSALAIVLLGAGSSLVGGEETPAFFLFFSGLPSTVPENPGTPYVAEWHCLLRTEPTDDPSLGATGWSIGFSAEGVTITEVTTEGTYAGPSDDPPGMREGGFERTELTTDGVGDCAGRAGAISVVSLSDLGTVALPVDSARDVIRFRIEGEFPGAGQVTPVRLFHVDGCKGSSGDPVVNRVSYRGGTVAPQLDESGFHLGARSPCPQAGDPLQVILQRRSVGQTPELLAGIIPTPDPFGPGVLVVPPGRADVHVGIVSDHPDPEGFGVQGWSLSIGVSGDIELVAVTTRGTAAGLASGGPPGLRPATGFEKTEIVDPDREYMLHSGFPQGQGAVSAIVLDFWSPLALEPVGTATVLALTLEGDLGATGTVGCRHGLLGSGGPVANVATVHGGTKNLDCCQWGEIRFAIPESPFHRGDVNDDGRIDISDPVRLLENLFLGATRPRCRDAADFNDDGGVDISDAIGPLSYLFLGGPEPPAPGPPGRPCGTDPLPHTDAGCEEYVSCL